MTYLLFIKRLDELQTVKEKKANRTQQPVESPIFNSRQQDYYAQLAWADAASDCSGFIEFMLPAIAESLDETIAAEMRVEALAETRVEPKPGTPDLFLSPLLRTPSMAIAGQHAARAGWTQREGLPCRRQCNSTGQPFLACPRHDPPDTAWDVPAGRLPWLRCHPSTAGQHPGCRPRCSRRWPTSRHVPSLATQERARRFRSISAWASSMTCWCGMAGRVSARAS